MATSIALKIAHKQSIHLKIALTCFSRCYRLASLSPIFLSPHLHLNGILVRQKRNGVQKKFIIIFATMSEMKEEKKYSKKRIQRSPRYRGIFDGILQAEKTRSMVDVQQRKNVPFSLQCELCRQRALFLGIDFAVFGRH